MIGTISLIAALVLAPPQGGQGGFGGGGAGGAQGGQGGRMGDFGQEQTYNHILTPGDKTEWPFKVKAGEVIIFRANSDNFDPAIEVQDADKKKIAENDDEEPGKQDALLLVYFEKEGTYTAHVKNYRSTAGGQYTFHTRRFVTTTLEPDKPLEFESKPESSYFRIPMKKNQIVSLFSSSGISFSAAPIGPDGKPIEWLPVYEDKWRGHVRAEQDGAYYVQLYIPPVREAKSIVSAVTAREQEAVFNQPKTVDARKGLDLWRYKAKAGDLLRISAKGDAAVPLSMGALPPVPEDMAGASPAFNVIDENAKMRKSTVVLFDRDGEYEIFVSKGDQAKGYTLQVTQAWKPWDGLSSFNGDLEIGATAYFGFDAKPGHIVRLSGEANTFDLKVDIFDKEWRTVFRQDDSNGTYNPEGTLSLSMGGRHYFAVSCYGGGGGGAYHIETTPIKPTLIRLGESKEATLNTPLDGLWTFSVDKSGTYSIRLKSPSGYLAMTDSDGRNVPVRTVMVQPNDFLMFFDLPKAGEYRIWRQFNGRPEKYTIKLEAVTG